MTLPVVSSTTSTGTSSTSLGSITLSVTLSSVSNGKLLAFCLINTSDDVTQVQSNIDGNFTLVGSELCTESSSNLRLAIYEKLNPTAGTHTLTATRSASGTTVRFYMVAVHVSGAAQVASTLNSGTLPVTDAATFTDTMTTTVSDELLLVACAAGGATTGSTTSVTPGAGQTNLAALIATTTNACLAVGAINASSPGTFTASWTWDVSQRRAATYMVALTPAAAGADTTPDAFTFTDVGSVPRNSTITSTAITVSGITAPANVTISNGTWEKNNSGVWNSGAGTVANGDTVKVRHTSSSAFSTNTDTLLTIGGVSDTFTSTTGVSETFNFTLTVTDSAGTPVSVGLVTSVTVGPFVMPPAAPSGIGRTLNYNAGTTADYIVAQDGSGTHSTITAAIAAATSGKMIRVKAGRYYETPSMAVTGVTLARYGSDIPVISGGLQVTGWAQCVAGDSAVVGIHYASIYKATINTSQLAHTAYNAMMLTENDVALNIVTRRRDETDLWEQSDDSAFFRVDQGDSITFTTTGTASSGSTVTVSHSAVLGNGSAPYTDAQLANCAVMLLADPNVPKVIDVASSSGGVLTLATNTAFPDFSPSGGAYALLNILPYMAQGQWGYVNNGDGTLTIYLWPNDVAHLAAGIEVAAKKTVLTITGSCTIDGMSVTHTADTATNTAPIYVNGAQNCTIKETRVFNFAHSQKGYGGIYAKSSVGFKTLNCDIEDGQNQYGFFCAGGNGASSVTNTYGTPNVNSTRISNVHIKHCSQTGPRFYGSVNVAFWNFYVELCGRAAHANKFNFYEGCDQIYVGQGTFYKCGGYGTIQESSRFLMHNVMCPTDNGSTSSGGRGFVDQTHSSSGQWADPSTNYIINCAFPKSAGAYTGTNGIMVGQPYWTVQWKLYNNVTAGMGTGTSSSAKLLDEDYNLLLQGASIMGAHDQTSTPALFKDPGSDNFNAVAAGNLLNTMAGKDVTAIIVEWEGYFPDVPIRRSIGGAAWNPAIPGIGPYGAGAWPVAA